MEEWKEKMDTRRDTSKLRSANLDAQCSRAFAQRENVVVALLHNTTALLPFFHLEESGRMEAANAPSTIWKSLEEWKPQMRLQISRFTDTAPTLLPL